MNGPEHFGGNMTSKEKELAARDAAVAKYYTHPKVIQGEIDRRLELEKHGITPIPVPTQTTPTRKLFKPRLATVGGVRVPSTPPQKSRTEVDQHELILGEDGEWIRKEE
jgi:hypothetical protein